MPVDSGWPASRFAALLDNGALQNQNQLDADLQGWLSEEHKANGEHGNIVADSITLNPADPGDALTGKVIVQDEDEKQTQFYRTRALETLIDMLLGNTLTLRNQNYQGVLQSLVKLGYIQHGSAADPGISLEAVAANLYARWGLTSGQSSAGGNSPALFISNLSVPLDPISLRYRSAATAYEWMKTVGGIGPTTEIVTLGSDFDSSLQGYWDALFVKSIHLSQGSGGAGYGLGIWVDIAFSSGDYGGNGAMTWTNIVTHVNAYTTVGPTVTVAYSIVGDVAGTPSDYLKVTLPNSWTIAGRTVRAAIGWCDNGGTIEPGYCQATVGDTFLRFYLGSLGNWTGGGSTSAVYGEITFSVNG